MIYETTCRIDRSQTDREGLLTLSDLLKIMQDVSRVHCDMLGVNRVVAQKGLFWAVLRHRVCVQRLPKAGQSVRVQTWPMPQTRAAFPRAVRCLDADGNCLFYAVSLWALMDKTTRTLEMRSGVTVPGIALGDEPLPPVRLPPQTHTHSTHWTVGMEDLDENGHVNNTCYLRHVQSLPGVAHGSTVPLQLTVCYLAENLLGQDMTLAYTAGDDAFCVDAYRQEGDHRCRVFACQLTHP